MTAPILGIARVAKTFGVEGKGKYIILAFHDHGSCSAIRSVAVSYYFCPEFTFDVGSVSLPQFTAPANNSKPVKGYCITNAVFPQGIVTMECQSDGVWNINSLKGRCVCKEDTENRGECKGR